MLSSTQNSREISEGLGVLTSRRHKRNTGRHEIVRNVTCEEY